MSDFLKITVENTSFHIPKRYVVSLESYSSLVVGVYNPERGVVEYLHLKFL